jgi:TonB family protein
MDFRPITNGQLGVALPILEFFGFRSLERLFVTSWGPSLLQHRYWCSQWARHFQRECTMATTASHTAMDEPVVDFSSQFLSDLQGLLEKAGRFTGATSAAMAFVEGEELVTKVSMGECAPDPGSRSPIAGSFTGLCVQQHDVQRCDDASKDERVDSAACEALGISSMVIVPISEDGAVLGVLAAFSAKPKAFSPTHVALLRTIADIVIELRKRYPADPHPAGFGMTAQAETANKPQVDSPLVHSAPDIANPEIKRSATNPAATSLDAPGNLPLNLASAAADMKPKQDSAVVQRTVPVLNTAAELHATMAAVPVAPEEKKPEKIEVPKQQVAKPEEVRITETNPAAEKKSLGPVLVKPEAKPKVEHSVELWKREPLLIKNVEETEEYARVIPDESKKQAEILSTADDIGFAPVAENEAENVQPPMFGYGYSATKAKTGGRSLPIAKTIVAVLALAVFATAATWFFKHNSQVAQPQGVQAAAVQSSAPEAQPQATSPQVTPDTAATPDASGPGIAMVVKKTDMKMLGGKKDPKIPDSEPVPDTTIILNGGTVPKHLAADETVAPPKVAADGSAGMKNILNMVNPTTQPEAAFHSSTITAPELIKQVAPRFPVFARQMHIASDRVILNGTVEKDGSVSKIKVVRGSQIFVQPAIEAVRQWKYKPAMLNGQTTPSTVEIVVNFVDR